MTRLDSGIVPLVLSLNGNANNKELRTVLSERSIDGVVMAFKGSCSTC